MPLRQPVTLRCIERIKSSKRPKRLLTPSQEVDVLFLRKPLVIRTSNEVSAKKLREFCKSRQAAGEPSPHVVYVSPVVRRDLESGLLNGYVERRHFSDGYRAKYPNAVGGFEYCIFFEKE